MGALFGKKSKPKQPELSDKDKAILELKRQRDGLRKYKEKIALVVAREVEVCKTLMKNGQKKRALLALRKKKYQEQLMEKTDSQLFNIEEMVNSIEFAAVSVKVFDALKQGNTILQAINAEVSIEAVEKLMDESAEAIEYQIKVSEMLAGSLTQEDESAIEEEFEKLQSEELVLELPDAPRTVLQKPQLKEEHEAQKVKDTKQPVVVLT